MMIQSCPECDKVDYYIHDNNPNKDEIMELSGKVRPDKDKTDLGKRESN